MTARRIVCIFLPLLAIERWQILTKRSAIGQQADPAIGSLPVALAKEGPHGPVVHAVNDHAQEQGVQVGSRLVDMRALCPDLIVQDADCAGDQKALDQLVLWARRWCPWTAKDASALDDGSGETADGLVLETTGSDHLFGGEAAMLRDMEKRFADMGLTAYLAVAPTWGSAWALSRFARSSGAICLPESLAGDLAPLPVSALRLDAATVLLMRRLGLKTVGSVAQLPRLSLARRFARSELSANPLLRLDQAMGRLDEPLSSREDPPVFRARIGLPDPIFDPTHYLPLLCNDLCEQLEHKGLGCRRLHLTVYRADGQVSSIMVATSRPSRDAHHLHCLFDGKLEQIDPGFGFDLITLTADGVEPLEAWQVRLSDGPSQDEGEADLSRLIDQLTARLGSQAVLVPAPFESHVPERAEGWREALGAEGGQLPAIRPAFSSPERPIRLFDRPERVDVLYAVPEGPPAQFVWRRQTHKVLRYAGPERIAPEWWRERSTARLRDYYRIEDQTGRRFWLYREGLHGDGRGAEPLWYLHGMFA